MIKKSIIICSFFLFSITFAKNLPVIEAKIEKKENILTIKITKIKINDELISIKYLIKKGDILSQIARKHKVSIKKIAKDNNIKNIDFILAGDYLIINLEGN